MINEKIRFRAFLKDIRADKAVMGWNKDGKSYRFGNITVGDYAKVYSGAVLLPGVTVGRQAIVAAGSLVTHDVPDNMVAAGRPATILRERRTEGHDGVGLDHIWLF